MKTTLSPVFLLTLIEVVYAYSEEILTMTPKLYAKGMRVQCDVNQNYVQNISCKLKAINWEQTLAYMDADLIDVVRNASIQLEAYKYTNQFRPFLINVTFNYCELFDRGLSKNPYMKAALNIIAKYSNINHKCPYSGHLYCYGGYVDFKYIPFYIPIGTYKLVFNFYEGWPYIHLGTVKYNFQVAQRNNSPRREAIKARKSIIEPRDIPT